MPDDDFFLVESRSGRIRCSDEIEVLLTAACLKGMESEVSAMVLDDIEQRVMTIQ